MTKVTSWGASCRDNQRASLGMMQHADVNSDQGSSLGASSPSNTLRRSMLPSQIDLNFLCAKLHALKDRGYLDIPGQILLLEQNARYGSSQVGHKASILLCRVDTLITLAHQNVLLCRVCDRCFLRFVAQSTALNDRVPVASRNENLYISGRTCGYAANSFN